MRKVVVGLAALGLIAACSKAPLVADAPSTAKQAAAAAPAAAPADPQPPSGPPVSGAYTVGGESAQLTDATAHADDPFNGEPVTAILLTTRPQDGGATALTTLTGNYGDAIIVRVLADGRAIGEDFIHHGLDKTGGHLSGSGIITLTDYRNAGGQISGRLSSNGPTDEFGQSLNVDLTFHAKSP